MDNSCVIYRPFCELFGINGKIIVPDVIIFFWFCENNFDQWASFIKRNELILVFKEGPSFDEVIGQWDFLNDLGLIQVENVQLVAEDSQETVFVIQGLNVICE